MNVLSNAREGGGGLGLEAEHVLLLFSDYHSNNLTINIDASLS